MRWLVPLDVAAALAGSADIRAVIDRDAVDVGLDGDLCVWPACERPTWSRWPPVMMAPREETRLLTVCDRGSSGGPAIPARAPRRWGRVPDPVPGSEAQTGSPSTLLGGRALIGPRYTWKVVC